MDTYYTCAKELIFYFALKEKYLTYITFIHCHIVTGHMKFRRFSILCYIVILHQLVLFRGKQGRDFF